MGLLYLGTPLSWAEAKQYADHVREHGITQFLNIWDRVKERTGDELLWGDELEYIVVSFDDETHNARLSLRQTEILAKLSSVVNDLEDGTNDAKIVVPTFHPEYGRYMLESTPGAPYTGAVSDLLSVENNMRYRRTLARKYLLKNEVPLTFTSFPRLGVQGVFTDPEADPSGAVSSHSLFLPEEITNPHARFPTLTANIRTRRGSKVAINLPIFFDKHTPRPFIDPTIPWDRSIYPEDPEAKNGAAHQDHIYLDAMGFGMGCCCLQITFQACSVNEARRVYDALVPIGPIMLALSAASPAYRGYLADVDCRWNVIAGSVDDRTEEERGLKPLNNDCFRIPKSRYDSVDLYLSEEWTNRPEYNDNEVPYDETIYKRLMGHGIDSLLARHFAHLFIRDPLVIFSETIHQDDKKSSDHFENLQSTNWQTMRFKPPPPETNMGWRVEFRSMEVQMTDFENAAYAAFIVLLSRAILGFGLNFYVPISKVDENMQTAQKRDAARQGKFHFRKNVLPPGQRPIDSMQHSPCDSPCGGCASPNENGITSKIPSGSQLTDAFDKVLRNGNRRVKETKLRNCFPNVPRPESGVAPVPVEEEHEEMSLEEIFNGKGPERPGLLCLVEEYLQTLDIEPEARTKLDRYLDLIRRRSKGSLVTPATWIRNFIRTHPDYKFDSVVSQQINYDLLKAVDEIERGVRREPTLLPADYCGGEEDGGCL